MTSYKTNLATSCYDTFDHQGQPGVYFAGNVTYKFLLYFFNVFDKRIQNYEDGVGQILTEPGQ